MNSYISRLRRIERLKKEIRTLEHIIESLHIDFAEQHEDYERVMKCVDKARFTGETVEVLKSTRIGEGDTYSVTVLAIPSK